jgi:fructose-1,6-bisphosphatase/inositol monophosphatase family enzyme
MLLTTEIRDFKLKQSGALEMFLEMQRIARVSRTWGDGYGYLMVATGRAEIMIDPILSIWDAAALQPVIEEAGGHFGDWKGNPTIRAGEALATNAAINREVLRHTAGL